MHDFPKEFAEMWAAHEMFRTLGFLPDEIFVSIGDDKHVLVVLVSQEKTFGIHIGKTTLSKTEFESTWDKFVNALPFITDDQLENTWTNSMVRANISVILERLLKKGFVCPYRTN